MKTTQLKTVRILATKGANVRATVRVVVPVSQAPRVSVGAATCCCSSD